MDTLKLSTFGIDNLRRGFAEAPEMAKSVLFGAFTGIVAKLEAELKGPEAYPADTGGFPAHTGTTRNSIRGDVFLQPAGVLGLVASPLPVAAFVELGTRPHVPPVEPLVQWVADRLGVTGPEGESIAWAIRTSIAKRGSRPRLFFSQTLQRNLAFIRKECEDAAAEIARRLVAGADGSPA